MARRYLGVQQMKRVDKQIFTLLIEMTARGSSEIRYQELIIASEYTERHLRRVIRRLEDENLIRTSRVNRVNHYEILKHE